MREWCLCAAPFSYARRIDSISAHIHYTDEQRCPHFLSVEDAVTAGDLLLEKLSQQYRILQEETAAEK